MDRRTAADTTRKSAPAVTEKPLEERLLRLAHMFDEHREDTLMRELCRLAIKCAQEGWTHHA